MSASPRDRDSLESDRSGYAGRLNGEAVSSSSGRYDDSDSWGWQATGSGQPSSSTATNGSGHGSAPVWEPPAADGYGSAGWPTVSPSTSDSELRPGSAMPLGPPPDEIPVVPPPSASDIYASSTGYGSDSDPEKTPDDYSKSRQDAYGADKYPADETYSSDGYSSGSGYTSPDYGSSAPSSSSYSSSDYSSPDYGSSGSSYSSSDYGSTDYNVSDYRAPAAEGSGDTDESEFRSNYTTGTYRSVHYDALGDDRPAYGSSTYDRPSYDVTTQPDTSWEGSTREWLSEPSPASPAAPAEPAPYGSHSYSPPADTYSPPAADTYSTPADTYSTPAADAYSTPADTYSTPAADTYSPPSESYSDRYPTPAAEPTSYSAYPSEQPYSAEPYPKDSYSREAYSPSYPPEPPAPSTAGYAPAGPSPAPPVAPPAPPPARPGGRGRAPAPAERPDKPAPQRRKGRGKHAALPPSKRPESSRDLTVDQLVAPKKIGPKSGWRRALYSASGGRIDLGESEAEQVRQMMIERIKAPTPSSHRIAVISLKGGVGKTTMSMGLGAMLAANRGDRIIAVDANPDRGTLSDKVTLQTDQTVRDLLNVVQPILRYGDVRRFTTQSPDRLEILASERDPGVSDEFAEMDYRRVISVLERFYNVVITDCGTGLVHSTMAGVLKLAHQLVVVSSAAYDGAKSASATLDWLEAHGHTHLVRGAVAVINSTRPGAGGMAFARLEQHFASRCRAVVQIPFDPTLETGADVVLDNIAAPTRESLLELAAVVCDGIGPE